MCYESYDTIFILYATTSCCPSDFLVCCLPVQTLASKRRGRPGPEFGATDPADTFVAEPATFDDLMVLSVMQYTWNSTYLPLTSGLGIVRCRPSQMVNLPSWKGLCSLPPCCHRSMHVVGFERLDFFGLDSCGDSMGGGHLVYLRGDLCARPSWMISCAKNDEGI